MYHLHTEKTSFDFGTYNFVVNQNFSPKAENGIEAETRLRKIADQSFDLLSQIQKLDKLAKLGHLSQKEQFEYKAMISLVGIMIHVLNQYGYTDKEMMDALLNRFHKFENGQRSVAA